jgi:bZIP Maf transcription factor
LNTSKDIETENSTGVVTNRLKRGPGRPPKYTDVDTSLPMEEIRQARRRFANRESARRLRKRKIEASAAQMEEIEYLNNKIDDLEAENEELKALLAVNEMENQKLKELLGNKD